MSDPRPASQSSPHQHHPRPFGDHVYQPIQRDPSDGTGEAFEDGPTSSPHVAEMDRGLQRHLTRVQVITPLSILLNLASLVVCSILIKPGLGDVNKNHITQFTPNENFILFYWALLFLLQIGFAVLIVAGQKDITKRTIVHGVGLRLAFANLCLGAWAIAWVVDNHASFIAGLVLLSLIGVMLLITSLVLAIKYPASSSRPLDWLFIHAPIKMFLVIGLQLDIPQMLFMALGWYDHPKQGGHHDLRGHWPSFYILTGMGALSAIWIFATSDVVWAAAGIYLYFALLYSKAPVLSERPPEIVAAIILAMVLQAVALVGSLLYQWAKSAQTDEGRVALGRNPQEEAAAMRAEAEAEAAAAAARERSLAQGSTRSSLDSTSPANDPSALERGETPQSPNGVKVSRRLGSSTS